MPKSKNDFVIQGQKYKVDVTLDPRMGSIWIHFMWPGNNLIWWEIKHITGLQTKFGSFHTNMTSYLVSNVTLNNLKLISSERIISMNLGENTSI